MAFVDKLQILKKRKERVVALEQECKSCGKITAAVKLETGKLKPVCCDTPEFDINWKAVGFTLRDMTGAMHDEFEADGRKCVKFKGANPDLNTLDTKGRRALILAMTLVDDDSEELKWDYRDKQAIAAINEFASSMIEPLVDEALDLCGLSAEAQEEAEKKSDPADQNESG